MGDPAVPHHRRIIVTERKPQKSTGSVQDHRKDNSPKSEKESAGKPRVMVTFLVTECCRLSAVLAEGFGALALSRSRGIPAWPHTRELTGVAQLCQGEQDPHPDPTLTLTFPALHPAVVHTFTLSPPTCSCSESRVLPQALESLRQPPEPPCGLSTGLRQAACVGKEPGLGSQGAGVRSRSEPSWLDDLRQLTVPIGPRSSDPSFGGPQVIVLILRE